MKWAAMAVLMVLAVGCKRAEPVGGHTSTGDLPPKSTVLRDHNGRAWIVTQDCWQRRCEMVRVPEVDTHGE
ncbi:hypothetical protein DLP05_051 [Stenotrophomonas phage vB_SmaS_DLP_5]|uniref:Lipoprotein n=1 Tax=Stenotrophomonas phage vB_SmaS_DLP_5 TaxID=2044561 RepID=A0A2D2W2N3_9CAUD|nr:hypothetical protein FDJ07_gp050 [Stenotrophomonas phage vB_SmaS_DLP_5]ATS92397.1 hypothetical protein DLP05_051 [Stenotrophomonas phage vB_SmaS_DLP_5]